MVGVPGRSKACHNCRQRRMAVRYPFLHRALHPPSPAVILTASSKCDGKRPGCDNCSKSGRLCTGYQRNHAFIFSKEVLASKPGIDLNQTSDTELVLASRWRIDHSRASTLPSHPKALSCHTLNNFFSLPPDIASCNVFRDKLIGLFLEHQLPAFDQPAPGFEDRRWMREVVNLPAMTPALEHAVLAVCTAKLGRMNNQPALVHKSLSLYNRSLHELRRSLRDSALRTDEQNFATSSILLLYEISECPGRNMHGYVSHYNGMMQLLQLRGASAYKTGLSHTLFQTFRVHTVSFAPRRWDSCLDGRIDH
jgi:hypothetical protein